MIKLMQINRLGVYFLTGILLANLSYSAGPPQEERS
jgi:hypothetical protein